MKYTNYVINGKLIDTKELESLPKIMLPISLTVALTGVVILVGVLPIAVVVDGVRNAHAYVLKQKRTYNL
jgi:hypothetical protein